MTLYKKIYIKRGYRESGRDGGRYGENLKPF
jgi:hypothetical protein